MTEGMFNEGFAAGVQSFLDGELALNMAALWADSKYGSKDDLWEKFNGVG